MNDLVRLPVALDDYYLSIRRSNPNPSSDPIGGRSTTSKWANEFCLMEEWMRRWLGDGQVGRREEKEAVFVRNFALNRPFEIWQIDGRWTRGKEGRRT